MKIISIDQPVKIHTSCSSYSLNDLLNASSASRAGLDKLNNSALRASSVSAYLVGMGCILEDLEIIASPKIIYLSRMYYFSSKMAKKAVFLSLFSQLLSVFYKN
ncbi:hypothetical protein [Acinetobacter sp. WCHAc010034]|uniref:hypothetical protein n=1 Tax=Acinetobacter sp. WCHAc010034 TaxID=1879049 RepID=UPI0013C30AA3|nr:hypothetical protein [Acinetobacter sp. WCHAc010034]